MFQVIQHWFLGIGDKYGVNPFIFGAIYVGAIPFFSLSIAWLIRNYRKGKSITLPILAAGSCFVSAYVYLLIAGKNVPWWVYGILMALLVYGAYSTIVKVRKKVSN